MNDADLNMLLENYIKAHQVSFNVNLFYFSNEKNLPANSMIRTCVAEVFDIQDLNLKYVKNRYERCHLCKAALNDIYPYFSSATSNNCNCKQCYGFLIQLYIAGEIKLSNKFRKNHANLL